jgi:hypothetical protein
MSLVFSGEALLREMRGRLEAKGVFEKPRAYDDGLSNTIQRCSVRICGFFLLETKDVDSGERERTGQETNRQRKQSYLRRQR